MNCASISESVSKFSATALKGVAVIVLLLAATSISSVPAQAQSSDTWKSVAIIGGSTAAGAYIGHKVAGTTGAYVGAAIGASAGYAIDRRRRENDSYNNEYGYYPNDGGYYPSNGGGYYPDNGGYYPNSDPYYGNGGYYGNGQNGYPYQFQNQSRHARHR